MASGQVRLSSVAGGGSVGFKHKDPTQAYDIELPNENMSMPIMRLSTAKTATGTAVDFTDVPTWAKKITVMFNGVSTNSTNSIYIQLGTSLGVETTGYQSVTAGITSAIASQAAVTTSSMVSVGSGNAGSLFGGKLEIVHMGGNLWVGSHIFGDRVTTVRLIHGSSEKALAGTLDRIRITTVNGTDTFDAGSINVLYEGY